MTVPEKLVNVTRGPLTESVHRGHIAVVDRSGALLRFAGDPAHVTFARSTAKLMQAIPVLESGAADRFAFAPEEVALICASHSGEPAHTETVRALLDRLGLSEASLQCGAHPPFDRKTAKALRAAGIAPTSAHNNCSGKHTGMLALALMLGAPTDDYLSPQHPVQLRMLEAFAELCGVASAGVHLGVDGCGAPVYGVPLEALARGYAQLGSPADLARERAAACRRIVAAIAANPRFLAGSGRFDTRLIAATQGRIIGKMGAEGVFAIAVPDEAIGIAVKVEDGAQRALYPAALETLRQLDLLTAAELDLLASDARPAVTNWAGAEVGRIEPCFKLAHR